MNSKLNLFLCISNILLSVTLTYVTVQQIKLNKTSKQIEQFQCPEATSQKLKSTVIDLNTKTVVCEYHKK